MRVKIKDIAKQIRGVSYKPIDVMDSLTKSSITLLRANNISDGFINFEEVAFINKQRVKGNQLLRKGDILICTSSGSKALVGKAAYVDKDMSMTFGAFCKVVRTIKGNARYLGYFFDSPYYRSIISNASAGANINNIKTNDIDNLEVKWPNIERQNEIAEILDKVTSIIDLRKHQIVELNQLTKSRFIEMFGNVGEIDKHKVHDAFVTKLGDVANVKSSHRVFTSEFVESGIPFYRGTEIGELSNGQIPKHPFYITREHYEKLANDDSRPKIGDLLLPSICNNGQIWLVDTNKPFYYKDGRVLCISPYPDVFNSIYLLYYLKYRLTYEYPKLGSGSTFAEFKIFQLKNMDVLVPNIMKQNLFANFIHQVDKSKMAVQKSLDELETLKKSLMQTYFG